MEGWLKLGRRVGRHCLLVAGSSVEGLAATSSTDLAVEAAMAPVKHSLSAGPQAEGEPAALAYCTVLSPTGTLSQAADMAANLEGGELCRTSYLKFCPYPLGGSMGSMGHCVCGGTWGYLFGNTWHACAKITVAVLFYCLLVAMVTIAGSCE